MDGSALLAPSHSCNGRESAQPLQSRSAVEDRLHEDGMPQNTSDPAVNAAQAKQNGLAKALFCSVALPIQVPVLAFCTKRANV